jgi:ABC-type branched-subunit amino acid transport system permease subunit
LAVLYAALIVLPHLLSFSQKEIAVFLLINTLLVASYRVLTLTGEWSLGHVVIMGVGGYASALFAKLIGLPVPLAMLAGAATAALVAYVLSFPLLRMKGFYFLIGSFAAGEVIRLIWKKFRVPFGGPKGLKLIPGFPDIELGGLKIAFFDPVNYYYLSLIVVSLSLLVLYRLERSRFGLTFHAVHWQDKLAESVGVDTRRYRTLAFVVASFFAGLSGALLAHYIGTVNPSGTDRDQRADPAPARCRRGPPADLRRHPDRHHAVPAQRLGKPGVQDQRPVRRQTRRRPRRREGRGGVGGRAKKRPTFHSQQVPPRRGACGRRRSRRGGCGASAPGRPAARPPRP